MPASVNNNDVKSDYQNGIVTLELPKAKQEDHSVKVNLKSKRPQHLSESESQSNDTNSDVKMNKPEGSYGNTSDLWNESENSEVETSTN